jgi:hypothetical protein
MKNWGKQRKGFTDYSTAQTAVLWYSLRSAFDLEAPAFAFQLPDYQVTQLPNSSIAGELASSHAHKLRSA